MFDELILVHRLTETDPTPMAEPVAQIDSHNWVLWKTCIRQMALGSGSQKVSPLFVRKTDKIYRGAEAYQFFLEVVTGLHSPIIGETEVMGQFKELLSYLLKMGEATPIQVLVQKFLVAILADSKIVRDTHLRDLGNRSYGSLLRRHVKGCRSLHILGGGKLVRDILPWLVGKTPSTTVYCRREEQGMDLKKDFSKIKVKTWPDEISANEILDGGTWIIAAPLSAKEIKRVLQKAEKIENVIDLREYSHSDPLEISGVSVLKLKEFFNQIADTQKEVQIKASRARDLVVNLCLKRFRSVEIRPFGWEDLCG